MATFTIKLNVASEYTFYNNDELDICQEVIVIIIVMINGISFVTPTRIFSTKYYSDPKKAFEKEYTPSAVEENIEIIKDLDLYDLDDNNTLYFCITKNNNLIACTMHKKSDKYFYSGFYELYGLNKYKEGFSSIDHTTNLFDKSGEKFSICKWVLISDINEIDVSNYYKLKTLNFDNEKIQLYLLIK